MCEEFLANEIEQSDDEEQKEVSGIVDQDFAISVLV